MRRLGRWAVLFAALTMAAMPVAMFFTLGSLGGWRKFIALGTANLAVQAALPMVRDAWRAL